MRTMIDWITLKCPRESVSAEAWAVLEARAGRIMKVWASPEYVERAQMVTAPDGSIEWMRIEWVSMARDSIRSDSHQTTIRAFGDWLEIQGSPARVSEQNNVFGSGNPRSCAVAMIRFVERTCDVQLPLLLEKWKVTRMDITHNYDLGSSAEVRQALSYLRHAEGGRYQVRTSSESVYWGEGSRLRRGKAYHKGPHCRYLMKQGVTDFTEDQIEMADRLLRLEVTLASTWWGRQQQAWHQMREQDLDQLHSDYFGQFVGSVEVREMDNLLGGFEAVAATPGQALAAYRTWSLIKTIGKAETQASMPRATWYRHKAIMEKAGLTWADFNLGQIVPFRRRVIELGAPVRSWAELRLAA